MSHIAWAVGQGFGIIDVNVPHYHTQPEDTESHVPRMTEEAMQGQLQELVCYIWDNYLQISDAAQQIFVMGVGQAYLGVKMLLVNRGGFDLVVLVVLVVFSFFFFCSVFVLFLFLFFSLPQLTPPDCKSRITGVVNFVSGSLRAVKSDADPDLTQWYKTHSRVYVGSDHACWQTNEFIRKINKRRFGDVVRSPFTGLNRMLREHAADAHEWIVDRLPEEHGNTTEDES